MKFLAVFVAVLAVSAAAPRVVTWDANELSAAIDDPNTDPAMVPYLIDALNTLMEGLWSGSPATTIPVLTPAGAVSPADVVATPVEATPAEAAVVPEAVVAPAVVSEASSGSPLVQLIINVNAGSQSAGGVTPAAVAEPVAPVVEVPAVTPVAVVDQPAVSPVAVVEQPEVTPIVVVDQPAVVAPVQVVEQPAAAVNPIDVIAVAAPEANPIDVVAVAAPEVNPIDIISPVPAVAGGSDAGILV